MHGIQWLGYHPLQASPLQFSFFKQILNGSSGGIGFGGGMARGGEGEGGRLCIQIHNTLRSAPPPAPFAIRLDCVGQIHQVSLCGVVLFECPEQSRLHITRQLHEDKRWIHPAKFFFASGGIWKRGGLTCGCIRQKGIPKCALY